MTYVHHSLTLAFSIIRSKSQSVELFVVFCMQSFLFYIRVFADDIPFSGQGLLYP